jgi:hypothetical protein
MPARGYVAALGRSIVSEMDIEVPGEDAAEQARELAEEPHDELREVPLDVDEADAAEQTRDVGYDDDDYR